MVGLRVRFFLAMNICLLALPITALAGDSTSAGIQVNTLKPSSTYLLDSGIFEPTSEAMDGRFSTKKVCPAGFTPYFVVSMQNITAPEKSWSVQGSGLCVTGDYTTVGTTYQVAFLQATKSNYYRKIVSKQVSTYGGVEVYLNDYYQVGVYPIHADGFPTSIVNDVIIDDDIRKGRNYTNYGGGQEIFHYSVYCVPSTETPPGYGTRCNTNTPPFNDPPD